MNYMNAVRFHFAGTFRADVSTVNNDPNHYNNNNFVSSDQEYQTQQALNGWWQPDGTGSWRLYDVKINKACYSDGTSETRQDGVAPSDGLLAMVGADAGDRAAAKLVDLDPQQQLVSQIWGLQFRILKPGPKGSAEVVLAGEFEPTGFFDIWWNRQQGSNGDIGASACYQSVLTNLVWGDVSGSQCLTELKSLSPDILSIKFMVDSYAMSGPQQSFGRVVGTVGPASADGPHHFVPGRQMIPQIRVSRGQALPIGQISYGVCVYDKDRGKVLCDFGNSLPTTTGKALFNIGPVQFGINDTDAGVFRPLGESEYQSSDDWYENTAGVEEFPKGRTLTPAEASAIENNLLVWHVPGSTTQPPVFESEEGYYVRPDNFVLRLNHGETLVSRVYVTHFGNLKPGESVSCTLDDRGIQGSLTIPTGTPESGVVFQSTITSGEAPDGSTHFEVTGGDITVPAPGGGRRNPREPSSGGYGLDGQLYGIRCTLTDLPITSRNNYNFRNFISVMVYNKEPDDMPSASDVTWYDHVQPIFQQYSNLYPRPHGPRNYRPKQPAPPDTQPPPALNPIVDLSNYDDVAGFAEFVKKAMSLPVKHPNHMPVVRDLSEWKRQMILNWLDTTGGPNGWPNEGSLPVIASLGEADAPSEGEQPVDAETAALGGKTAAARSNQAGAESLISEADQHIPDLLPPAEAS